MSYLTDMREFLRKAQADLADAQAHNGPMPEGMLTMAEDRCHLRPYTDLEKVELRLKGEATIAGYQRSVDHFEGAIASEVARLGSSEHSPTP